MRINSTIVLTIISGWSFLWMLPFWHDGPIYRACICIAGLVVILTAILSFERKPSIKEPSPNE